MTTDNLPELDGCEIDVDEKDGVTAKPNVDTVSTVPLKTGSDR